jgi:hypothetical protein
MSEMKNVIEEVDPDSFKEAGDGFDAWWVERTLLEKVLLGILFAIGGIALLALFGLFVMLLWNWLMPDIFGLPPLDYWKAWGLLVLFWILFKGINFGDNNNGSTDRKRKRELRRYMHEGQDSAPTSEK